MNLILLSFFNSDYNIAIIGAITTLVVALIGIFGNMYLSNVNRRKELEIKKEEIEKEEVKVLLENLKGFWEEQSNILKQTLLTGTELTFNEDIESDKFLEEYDKLWRLIHGELPMYDVPNVEQALEKLADLAYNKKRLDPKDKNTIKENKREMKPLLTNLAKAIKDTSIVIEYARKLKRNIPS